MKAYRFNEIVEESQASSLEVLCKKAGEYATDDDRLANGKIGSGALGVSVPMAFLGMAVKHWTSVVDLCAGRLLNVKGVRREKIGDLHNYLHLVEAALVELEETELGKKNAMAARRLIEMREEDELRQKETEKNFPSPERDVVSYRLECIHCGWTSEILDCPQGSEDPYCLSRCGNCGRGCREGKPTIADPLGRFCFSIVDADTPPCPGDFLQKDQTGGAVPPGIESVKMLSERCAWWECRKCGWQSDVFAVHVGQAVDILKKCPKCEAVWLSDGSGLTLKQQETAPFPVVPVASLQTASQAELEGLRRRCADQERHIKECEVREYQAFRQNSEEFEQMRKERDENRGEVEALKREVDTMRDAVAATYNSMTCQVSNAKVGEAAAMARRQELHDILKEKEEELEQSRKLAEARLDDLTFAKARVEQLESRLVIAESKK